MLRPARWQWDSRPNVFTQHKQNLWLIYGWMGRKQRNYTCTSLCTPNHTTSYPSLLTVSTSQPSSAFSQPLSFYLLFTLQIISTYIFKIFLCFFLNKVSGGKSPVPWGQQSEFIPCQTVGPREQQEHSRSQEFVCQNTLGSSLGLICKKCKGLESSCFNSASGSLIFYRNVLHGKKSLATS